MSQPASLSLPVIEQMCALSGIGRPLRVTPRTGGELSGVFEVASTGAPVPVIIKVYAEKWAWKQPKELYVYGLLEPVIGWATPEIVDAQTAENPTGHAFTVMSRLPGQPLSEVESQLDPAAVAAVYRQIGALAATVHTVAQPSFGYVVTQIVDPVSTNAQYMSRQFDQKLGAFRDAGGSPALADRIERRLKAEASVLAESKAASLCHNDLYEGNLLIEPVDDGWRLSGLVDVENALAGDPLMDLAKTDCYSIRGDVTKFEALADGYGPALRAGEDRVELYRIYHTLDLCVWYHQIGRHQHHLGLVRQLERLLAAPSRRG